MTEKLIKKLNALEATRQPFDKLIKDIVCSVATEYKPKADVNFAIEMGAGIGKLARWLPTCWLDQLIRSDIDHEACVNLKRDNASLATLNTDATCLPFSDNALSGMAGLCVCDVLPDGYALAKEARRVLSTGAPFIHFADMSVAHDFTLRELLEHDLIPLLLKPLEKPEIWQQDLLVCSKTQFKVLLDLTRRQKHLSAEVLAEYLEWFSSTVNTAHIFMVRLQEDKKFAHYFESALLLLTRWLEENNISLNELLKTAELSSAELYSERFNDWFADDFDIKRNDILVAETTESTAEHNNSEYRSLCVGTVFEYDSAHYDTLFPSQIDAIPKDHTHLQLGIHVFSAIAK